VKLEGSDLAILGRESYCKFSTRVTMSFITLGSFRQRPKNVNLFIDNRMMKKMPQHKEENEVSKVVNTAT